MARFSRALAIRFTPYYAKSLGWGSDIAKICGILGFKNHYPDIGQFVTAVADWQQKNPPLHADGMLGPVSWRKMSEAIGAQQGGATFVGPHPDWIAKVNSDVYKPQPSRSVGSKVTPVKLTGEDEIIQEMVKVMMTHKGDTYVAVAVSRAYLGRQGYPLGVKSDFTGQPISQTLAVGQVWQGIAGPRIIVGLSGGGSMGSVIFVTDSGQGYDQSVTGWESDMYAKLWSDVSKNMKPMKIFLDVEAAFLIGLLSVSVPFGGAYFFTATMTQLMLENGKDMPKFIYALGQLSDVRDVLKRIAPTLYSKVVDVLVRRIASELVEAPFHNPAVIARFIGAMVGSMGKTWWLSMIGEKLPSMFGIIMEATIAPMLRASPGAVKAALSEKDLMDKLKGIGAAVSAQEASAIATEIATNHSEIKKQFDKMTDLALLFQK
jgi:hypothetical protein